MPLFQSPARTPEELEASKPLAIPPEEVLTFDEADWYKKAYRGDAAQLTVRAVGMGSLLGFLLSFTNIYIGLKTGWLLGVALTACILSFAISTFMVKAGMAKTPLSILETNCMQSTASAAGYTTCVTLTGPVSAMLMLSVTDANPKGTQLSWWIIAPWVLTTGALGVFMAIPMKRNLINREKLRFPSGTAAAVMLQGFYSHGTEALAKARALLWAAIVGMLVPLLKDLEWIKGPVGAGGKVERHALIPGQSNIFDWMGHIKATYWDAKVGAFQQKAFPLSDWTIRLDHSVVLVGAGAIVGLRATIAMVASGLYLAFVIGPAALENGWTNALGKFVTAVSKPSSAWKEIGIWYGAPLMVAYGLITFALQWRTIARAFAGFKRGAAADEHQAAAAVAEVPVSWFAIGIAVSGSAVVALGVFFFAIPIHLGAFAVFVAFFLALVAARATGETDITPGGPLGKLTQLVYGVLMPQSTTANLMTSSITSSSALSCADLLNDLRAGYLLGANPRRQFLAQFFGIFVGTIGSVLGYFLLVPDVTLLTGVNGGEPKFAAPAAQQWKVVAELFKYGIGNLHPMAQHGIVWGIVWGTGFALAEGIFPKYRKWIPSATGIGLGLLLPFYTGLAMFLGALAAWIYMKASPKQAERFTVPIASGIIAGESVIGVVVAALNNFVFN